MLKKEEKKRMTQGSSSENLTRKSLLRYGDNKNELPSGNWENFRFCM
jgi:hypothetical protein